MDAGTTLFGLLGKMKAACDRAVANKATCQVLVRRAEAVVESVQRTARHVPRDKALMDVEQAITDATTYITQFQKRGWFGRAWNSTSDEEQLLHHANEITATGQTLTVSLGGQMIIKQVWLPYYYRRRRHRNPCALFFCVDLVCDI
jgi:hypothetical protein